MLPQKLVRWIDWKRDPASDYRAQHEILIRLARRCAYDFAHAADFIPPRDPIAKDLGYPARAQWWISVFQSGNPAKDYRNKIVMELGTAENTIEQLISLCEKNNIEVPEAIMNKYRMPF